MGRDQGRKQPAQTWSHLPVYSPNLYFQMIGRGLRGPRNGGTDRCLIVNVQDNIDNFERRLTFSDLDWLWA